MAKAVTTTIAAILIVGAVAGAYWFGTQRALSNAPARAAAAASEAAGKGGAAPVTVEAAKVTTVALRQTITAVGSLRSDESVTLRPEVAGRINAIAFQEGQRVTKGVKLVQLDPAVPQAEVEQARANLTLAKTK